jgi:SAM-dependent methyltransferase
MTDHLQSIVEDAVGILERDPAMVLDIGCNDGTLLEFYSPSCRTFGVDPSDIAQEIDKNKVTVIQDVFPSNELTASIGQGKFDIITSIAMFYDLEDPIGFSKGIHRVLAPDGIWIFEMSYMPAMLEMTSYDTICHEHLEYYSLAVIEHILAQANLKIFNATDNDINGGSLRCYATHIDNFKYKHEVFLSNVQRMHQSEFDLELDTDKPYRNFQERINLHRTELLAILKKLKREGKRIHIYGASTKGNTILQWCGIDSRIIDYAAERNPAKYGAFTLGTDIPIVSEAQSRAMNPDYYLVLPWHFKAEFIEREQESLRKGIGFIFPLPTVEIIRG